jgi:N-acetylglucosamine-6-phosphate deacetylase
MLQGQILTPRGWVSGEITFDRRILRIEPKPVPGPVRHILPGFVDLHVHGAGGVDIMSGGDSGEVVARTHARHGTTSLLGTTMTAKPADIERALQGLAGVIATRKPGCARMLGVHLEGPYVNPRRLGAQPPDVLQGTLEQVRRFHALAPIRVLTLAPEIAGHLDLISGLSAIGIRVQIGHTDGTYEEGVAALKAGAAGFTHLFNAMTPLLHRDPGMVGAALAHAEYAELIPDLYHVHPGAMKVALRSIPKLYCVSDATAATDMPDGEYSLGTQRVLKCLGCVRLATGSLAGSALTLDQALRNLISLGLDLADASHRLSRNPADYLGETERGRLQAGAWADIVVMDEAHRVTGVFVEGEPVDLSSPL